MTDKRIVLITGANTGLGYQIVRSLLSSDRASTILLGGRSIGKANEARDAAVAEQPGSKSSIDVVQIDIEDDSSIQALCKTVESKYGKLDVLVNNAGRVVGPPRTSRISVRNVHAVCLQRNTGAQFDEEYKAGRMTVRQAWSKSWDLNVVSTHILTDALMPMLLRSDDPRLLFVASGTSSLTLSENTDLPFSKARPKGWPKPWGSLVDGTPAYKSSKTGMNMMMR